MKDQQPEWAAGVSPSTLGDFAGPTWLGPRPRIFQPPQAFTDTVAGCAGHRTHLQPADTRGNADYLRSVAWEGRRTALPSP